MLARVSTMLALARINIGGLSLGRYPGQTKALTIVALDDMPSKSILDEMAKLEGISDVHLIIL